jgi:hypothetical protein
MDVDVRTERMHAQLLVPGSQAASPVDVVRHLVGLQAQIASATALAIRVRTNGASSDDVERERATGGRLVQSWLMRGTLHLVAADDIDWLVPLLAPTLLARAARRYAELGLDEATLARSVDVLGHLLESGSATRDELFEGLAASGIDPSGQRGIHLVQHAAFRGVVCFGASRGSEPTWTLRMSRRDGLDREQALTHLALRYRTGYGPSDPRDLASWSGLTVTDAREAWRFADETERSEEGTGGSRKGADHPREPLQSKRPLVRLLPHFDPYLLGYRSRDLILPKAHSARIWTGGGYVLPTVVVDGQVVGTWNSERKKDGLSITVSPLGRRRPDDAVSAGIETEVADIGRFLQSGATWRIEPSG